jgi:site-specific DNA-methyltransferase (adenine-specific)
MNIYQGDCLAILPTLPDHSVNLICADLPYGITQCDWDTPIPLAPLWEQYQRLLIPGGAVVLTATMKFAVELINTSPKKWFRYDLVWDKRIPTGFLDCNRRPMRRHENLLVFGPKSPSYRPQMGLGDPYSQKCRGGTDIYGAFLLNHIGNLGTRYPTSVLMFTNANRKTKVQPTQKPIELIEWIIKTYSDEGDLVLDNCFGSGTTGIACRNLNRQFIGIEKDPEIFEVGRKRIEHE